MRNNSAYKGPFLKDMENLAEELAVWAVDYIEAILQTLMPDKRAFKEVLPDTNEQMMLYLKLRGNPEKWREWYEMKVMELRQMMTDSGLPEDEIVALGVDNIAVPLLVAYSSSLEALVRRNSERYVPSQSSFDEPVEELPYGAPA